MTPDVQRAALMAYRCLTRMQVDTLPVQPLQMLKKCRNTEVMSVDQAEERLNLPPGELARRCDEADAWTYRMLKADGSEERKVVFHTDGHPGRRRFSLAHELGHIVLNHDGSEPWQEHEADVFASHLLCPQPLLDCWRRNGPVYAEDVAATCFVSLKCAEMLSRRARAAIPKELSQKLTRLLVCAELDVRQGRKTLLFPQMND